jgi:hypothetical protein
MVMLSFALTILRQAQEKRFPMPFVVSLSKQSLCKSILRQARRMSDHVAAELQR